MDKDRQNKDRKLVVRITEKEHNEYKNYCDENGYSMSKRLRLLMKLDIENKLT